jgi:pimeloyl-ACP methyl ester carboxylesterase
MAVFWKAALGFAAACSLLAVCLTMGRFEANIPEAGLRWKQLPATPELPVTQRSGHVEVNGVQLWYASFGQGKPVILLHGGLANADYWGLQVPVLAKHRQVIVLDCRGHGRSTRDGRPYSYQQMSNDVIGLMDWLAIRKAAIVGWSDGGIIGLDLAMRYPERIEKVFAFAANTDPSGVNDSLDRHPVFADYLARVQQEYACLSSTPEQYGALVEQISTMWKSQPHFSREQLASIQVPVWVVVGDHDEAIKREHTLNMARMIPAATLRILPNVSHFAFLQDPERFTSEVLSFLEG